MTPGPNRVLRVSPSGALVKITTLMSGNTFGARFWTDGKREAPMLPERPWVMVHPATDEVFFIDEAKFVGEERFGQDAGEYRDVPFARAPTVEEYHRVLASGEAAAPEKEHYIRTRLWWLANDPVRREEAAAPASEEFFDNLRRLRAICDTGDPGERLMAAEISRELHDFGAASALLDGEFPEDWQEFVRLIKHLVAEEDFTVRERK